MPAWSNISWAQWMGRLRAPNAPCSRIGVRPAISRRGMRSRAALASRLMVLAVPTLTCTITACVRPVIRLAACDMPTARLSCGPRMDRGTPVCRMLARAKPSTMGGKSVPGLAKKNAMPCRLSDARMTSAAVASGVEPPLGIRGPPFAFSVELYVGGFGNARPARDLSGNLRGKLGARAAAGVDAQPAQARTHLGELQDRRHLLGQSLDDRIGRGSGGEQSGPQAQIELGHARLQHAWHLGVVPQGLAGGVGKHSDPS